MLFKSLVIHQHELPTVLIHELACVIMKLHLFKVIPGIRFDLDHLIGESFLGRYL